MDADTQQLLHALLVTAEARVPSITKVMEVRRAARGWDASRWLAQPHVLLCCRPAAHIDATPRYAMQPLHVAAGEMCAVALPVGDPSKCTLFRQQHIKHQNAPIICHTLCCTLLSYVINAPLPEPQITLPHGAQLPPSHRALFMQTAHQALKHGSPFCHVRCCHLSILLLTEPRATCIAPFKHVMCAPLPDHQITLPQGCQLQRTVTIANPYGQPRTFSLSSTAPRLLTFQPAASLRLHPGASRAVGFVVDARGISHDARGISHNGDKIMSSSKGLGAAWDSMPAGSVGNAEVGGALLTRDASLGKRHLEKREAFVIMRDEDQGTVEECWRVVMSVVGSELGLGAEGGAVAHE